MVPFENLQFQSSPNQLLEHLLHLLQEYEVIGIAFGMKKDFVSSPIKGKGGVYVLQKTSDIVEGVSDDNYTKDRETLATSVQNKAATAVFNSFKEEGEIEDNRYERR